VNLQFTDLIQEKCKRKHFRNNNNQNKNTKTKTLTSTTHIQNKNPSSVLLFTPKIITSNTQK